MGIRLDKLLGLLIVIAVYSTAFAVETNPDLPVGISFSQPSTPVKEVNLIAAAAFAAGRTDSYKGSLSYPEFTGEGTTVAIYEAGIALGTESLYGACVEPTGANDMIGWQPDQGTGAPCKVVWVQCFLDSNSSTLVYDAANSCDINITTLDHTDTRTAAGILAMAPDTRIVFLQTNTNVETRLNNYLEANRWLMDASNNESNSVPNGTESRLGGESTFRSFDGTASPIEFWNIVAVHAGGPVYRRDWDNYGSYSFGSLVNSATLPHSQPCNRVGTGTTIDEYHQTGLTPNEYQHMYVNDGNFRDLRAAGVLLMGSSGNFGHKNGLPFPKCMPEFLAVGATYEGNYSATFFIDAPGSAQLDCGDGDAGDAATYPKFFEVTCYSNSSPLHNMVFAPGGGGGTSLAGPIAAGMVAVLKSPGLNTTDMGAAEIHKFLSRHGPPVRDDRSCSDPGSFFPDAVDYGEFKRMHCDSDNLPNTNYYAPYKNGYEWDEVDDFVKPFIYLPTLIEAAQKDFTPQIRRRGIQSEMWKTGLHSLDGVN